MTAADVAKIAAATLCHTGSSIATSSAPTLSETKKAYWWRTPRRRGLTRPPEARAGAGGGTPASLERFERRFRHGVNQQQAEAEGLGPQDRRAGESGS